MLTSKKNYLACIPCVHKSLWQLRRLDDFVIKATENLYLHYKD